MKSKKEKKTKKEKITGKTRISEIVKNPKAVEILFEEGLFCIGCPRAMSENLEQACKAHGINIKSLLKKLNKPK